MQVTTFYSYKGGLGRSLLLTWTARALAEEGHKVVALDFDLEAPGLAFKLGFGLEDDLGPGLVGLLASFQRGDEPPDSLDPWLKPVRGIERLWLLPAGPVVSADYWRQLASLSWEQLFLGKDPQGVRFFHWLRETLERTVQPDHLLIDARTGVTEMGGAALSLMADQILALLGTAEEGVHGTREVLRAVVGAPRPPGRAVPRIGLILSRMPATMATPDLQVLRRAVRDSLCEEAEPLTTTLAVDLPIVVRSEPLLQANERAALEPEALRVHDDYRAVLSWLQGGGVPEQPPGIVVSVDASLSELENSIALQRKLAERQPEVYLTELASSLENLASAFANSSRQDEAMLAGREAVAIQRELAEKNPEEFEPKLASALNTLGNRLSDLGRREDALQATREAVELYGRLAKARPDVFEPGLAMALNNLGIRLSNLGRREDALQAAQEAVQIRRRLAKARPDAFEPGLASTLNNLGVMLSNLGRREDALQATQEAVELYGPLAKARPDAFDPDLAMALNNLGIRLSNLGRREDALQATQEAVELYGPLAKARPDAFEPDLAMALNNLGAMLSNLGRREDALQATQEAVQIRRRLAKARPDAFEPDLAMALNNLSVDLSNLGRREDALKATQEAVELYGRLAKARPDAFEPDLAAALNNLGRWLSALGRREEALQATREAVQIRRHLAKVRPDACEPDLAESLGSLGSVLAESDVGGARDAFEEALRVLLPHLQRVPDAFAGTAAALLRDVDRVGALPERPLDEELLARVRALLPAHAGDG